MNSKTKKHAILSLVAAMCLSLVVALVPAFSTWFATANGELAAKIGNEEYTVFADALKATEEMTGNVTVEIHDKVTLNQSLSGSYDSITFVGKDTDAEIYLEFQGFLSAVGKTVNFEDLTLSKSKGGYIGNAGYMNVAFGLYDTIAINYKNCTFTNGAYASGGHGSSADVSFDGCTFYRSWEKYGLWAYGNVNAVVKNCTFAIDRGIKMYAEGAAKTVDLTVTNTDFSAVTDKPAIVLTYGKSVTLAGNDYSATGTFELELNGSSNGTVINSTDEVICMQESGGTYVPCGAIVDGKVYRTVADAVAAAEDGDTVTLLHNSTESVTVENKSIKLNKNGYTAEGLTAGENGSVAELVAKIGDVEYTDLRTAIDEAADGATIEVLADSTVDVWESVWNKNNLTINGNGKTLTVNKVDSNVNGSGLLLKASNLCINDLTVNLPTNQTDGERPRLATMYSGNLYNVTVTGGNHAVSILDGGDGEVIIDNCNFSDINGWAIETENGKDKSFTVSNSKFDENAILFYGNTSTATITGNTITGAGEGVNVLGNAIITGNNFGESTLGIDQGRTVTIENNVINNIEFPNWYGVAKQDYSKLAVGENTLSDAALNEFKEISVAAINDILYYDFLDAVKALKANGGTLTLMNDVTIDYNWPDETDATTKQYARFELPVTIDGNEKTLTFKGQMVEQNWNAAFRFNAEGTVKNLTMDMSAVTESSFRAISAKVGLVVDNCTFIGNGSTNNNRAIIFGESAGSLVSDVSITNCTFKNWKRGVTDNEGGAAKGDPATNLTITGSTFEKASVVVSAFDKVTFNGNTMGENTEVNVKSYTNTDNLKVEFMGNTLADSVLTTISAIPDNIYTDVASLKPVAKIGTTFYKTAEDLLKVIQKEDTVTISADIKLYADLYLPEEVTKLAGGVKIVDGVAVPYAVDSTFTYLDTKNELKTENYDIVTSANLTIVDHVKVSGLNVNYTGLTITIGKDACLEITGPDRMVIGHNTTFNITGRIEKAKPSDEIATANVSDVTPSLIIPGASFTGNSLTFNATNAYIKTTASYCSSSKSASGTFNFNITNCIWEQFGKLAFEAQSTAATFNFNLKDSVLTTTSHLVFAAAKSNVVIDNSNVNVGTSRQLENRGTMTIKNSSVVNGANATSENATMPGTLIVDNAIYATTGEYTGSGFGIGTLIARNNANVTLDTISKANAYIDDTSTFTVGKVADTANVYTLNSYEFTLKLDKTVVKANESLTATVGIDTVAEDKKFYSAEYIFTYDRDKFICAADLDDDGIISVSNLYEGQAGDLATYTLIAKNDIDSVSSGNVLSVSGKVIQHAQQVFVDANNPVTGDSKEVQISLNYTVSIKADYVLGYSLVLVSGTDAGYAYNGQNMFYVEAYGAYAYIVKGVVTAEEVDAVISKTTDCEVISASYNVNAEYVTDGIVDLKDATAVYACFTGGFAVENYMELFLRADVNGDKVVNIVDVNAVTKNYTK